MHGNVLDEYVYSAKERVSIAHDICMYVTVLNI